jgi:heme O synthase-like polyprenyltransferase
VDAFRLKADGGGPKAAMRLFGYSITYVTAIFAAMAVDIVVRYH